ncbi:alpha/beta fold hydrolase [Trinickia diaoshuihuensis]|uniref:alpha/beta fold hydrolase n=1 Tax=Trinickia diaoshuihuensis TaxID=2292265 RepID=UPI000E243A63|nr:alpha/beta hydrolase [Trinickia diaoshuihuensis]
MSAWILLRGLAREARHWAQLPERLRSRGLSGEIVCADLPGCGEYADEHAPVSLAATTDFVRARLAARGYAPPYRVIALSLGAMVAVDWAQRFPLEVERLVLINTSLRRYNDPFQRLRPSAWPLLARAALCWHARTRRRAESAIHTLTCRRVDSREADLAAWSAIYESAPPTRRNAFRQVAAAARFRGAASAPCCPTLVLASRNDALVHPACSAKLAAIWGATLIEHPWAGHDLPHDDCAWLADTIAAWAGNALTVAFPSPAHHRPQTAGPILNAEHRHPEAACRRKTKKPLLICSRTLSNMRADDGPSPLLVQSNRF